MIVSDMPGTTRDAVDGVVGWHRREFRIVDTAGIRRPGRVARGGHVEAVSVIAARRAIERADVVALVIDASTGPVEQDAAIAGAADKAGRGIIIVANKWDLVKERGVGFAKEFDEQVRDALKFLDYAPIVHLSARTGARVPGLLETIDRVAQSRTRRVATAELNKFIQTVSAEHPPAIRGAGPCASCMPPRRRGAADICVVHEHRREAPFLVRTISGEPSARIVRLRRHADSAAGPSALATQVARQCHGRRRSGVASARLIRRADRPPSAGIGAARVLYSQRRSMSPTG